MRHLDVAIYGMATALLIVLIMVAPFGVRPKCFASASPPASICKVPHAR